MGFRPALEPLGKENLLPGVDGFVEPADIPPTPGGSNTNRNLPPGRNGPKCRSRAASCSTQKGRFPRGRNCNDAPPAQTTPDSKQRIVSASSSGERRVSPSRKISHLPARPARGGVAGPGNLVVLLVDHLAPRLRAPRRPWRRSSGCRRRRSRNRRTPPPRSWPAPAPARRAAALPRCRRGSAS